MTGPALVALDPLALAGLESSLHGVAEVYRFHAVRLADVLAGVGEDVEELAVLDEVARWCRSRRDEISRCRLLLGQLPVALPLPAWTFASEADAVRRAEAVGERLAVALEQGSVSWEVVAAVVAEVGRGGRDGAFAARLVTRLGPEATASLPWRIERAARAVGAGVPPELVDAAQEVVARTVLAASRHTGPGALSPAWTTRFAGLDPGPSGGDAASPVGPDPDPEVLDLLDGLGFGTGLARAVALGLGAGTVATVLGRAGAVVTVVRLGGLGPGGGHGGEGLDALDVASLSLGGAGSLGLYLVSAGIVATPLGVAAVVGGSIVAGALSWLLGLVDPPPGDGATAEGRRGRHTRAYDPDTGTAHFPGGGADQPHQDGAGGVLPPGMVR